jgi:hypothetical protein
LKIIKTIFLSIISISIFSCEQLKKQDKKEILAEANDKILYFEDINPEKLAYINSDDSIQQLKLYAELWSEEQILIDKAENQLDSNDLIDELLEEYRKNLLLHILDEKWSAKFYDTIVSEEEIETYYEENKNNFQLRKNIVRIRYLKLNEETSAKELKNVKLWIQNPTQINDSLLKHYAENKAINFYLENDWLYFDDLIKEVPISSDYNQERYLLNNRFVQLTENNALYLVYFLDFKFKDTVSPLEFEKSNIRSYILMIRKKRWVEKQRQLLLDNALKNGKIKIHLK